MFETAEMKMGSADTNVRTVGLHNEVVLALSRSGKEELRRPQAGLSLRQRKLLTLIDGKRSLSAIVAAEPSLHAERVPGDAAQLLGRGFVELEQGWLQPITRPTTVVPVAAPPTDRTSKPQASRVKLAAPAAQATAVKTKRPGSSRRTIWLALPAAAAVGIAAAYLMQPAGSGTSPTSASSAGPRPIINVPEPPRVHDAVDTAQRPATTPSSDAASTAAATASRSAQTVQQIEPPPARPAPSPVAAAIPDAAPSQSARAPALNAAEPGKVAAAPLPPATKPLDGPVAPETATVAVPAAPVVAEAAAPAAVVGTTEVPPAKATVAAAAPVAHAEVPAWAREFAPVAPEADSARAAAGGLSPIERVPPIYPREAARQGITRGSIRARAVLAANGSVERVEFPSTDAGNRVFERPARAALMTWVFPPGERGRVYEAVLNFIAP